MEKIKELLYNFKNGIKNLIKWFPVIWKDRNWDNHYIYMILRHKLHLTEQFIRYKGISLNAEHDANKIKVCINLLDRLIKDEYHIMAYKDIDKKWGELKMSYTVCKNNSDLHQLHLTRPNVKTEKDKIQEKKDFHASYKHEQYSKRNDLKYLFKLMSKHIESWWD